MNFHRSLSVSLFALGLTGMTAAQADTLADAINAALATNPGLQSQRVETDILVRVWSRPAHRGVPRSI